MAGKKANKIPKTTIVQAGLKTSSKTVDKKRITEVTEKKSQRSRKTQKTVRSKPTAQGVSAALYDINGQSLGKVVLPKEIFGQKPNKNLLVQAMRIYSSNQSAHWAQTKTRAEVRGGGAKPRRQKGSGKARAGSIRSPLWVGGGVALGPKYRKIKLTLPKKMKKKALVFALSSKAQAGDIKVIKNIENIQAKTKIVAGLLNKLKTKDNTLLVISDKSNDQKNLILASRNIKQISVSRVNNLNAFEIVKSNNLLFSKEALAALVGEKPVKQL